MTIGMIACGTGAGAGLVEGLKAVEKVARGAIGGFVSFVAVGDGNTMVRKTVQRGGAHALFSESIPAEIAQAPLAGLISSGPDRPEPLSSFIAVEPGVGIVTGHRMPQSLAHNGVPLNESVLSRMFSGVNPQRAIDEVLAENEDCDAGFLACTLDGVLGVGNAPSVRLRRDLGASALNELNGVARVATLHNAIEPHRVIASLANEVALDRMLQTAPPVRWITLQAGTPLGPSTRAALVTDKAGIVQSVRHASCESASRVGVLGLGDRVGVVTNGELQGWLGYEPFMTVRAGKIERIDGQKEMALPVVERLPGNRVTCEILASHEASSG